MGGYFRILAAIPGFFLSSWFTDVALGSVLTANTCTNH